MINSTKINWKLEKRITIGYLLTGLSLLLSAIWWAAKVESRIAVLETELEGISASQAEMDEDQSIRDARQDSEMDKLYSKLNRS